MSQLESVHYADNLSGVRLTEKYRQRLTGVFPPARVEKLGKKKSKKLFAAVLLPTRTASGWKIHVRRPLEVLELKYYSVPTPLHWRIHGDGREIGKRHSTVVSLTILNNEAVLYGVNFQSPDVVHPFHVFYDIWQ